MTDQLTSNGWIPAAHFNPEMFPDGAEFFVWLPHPDSPDGMIQIAQWDCEYAPSEDQSDIVPAGEKRFTGEWRHCQGLEAIEPEAFRPLMLPPDRGVLKSIVARFPLGPQDA